jgi:hypothetical protein
MNPLISVLVCHPLRSSLGVATCGCILISTFRVEAGTSPNRDPLVTREVFLGKLPIMAKNSAAVLSSDCQHIAIPCQHGLRWTVLLDGMEGPSYQGVHSLTFSPAGARLAYVGNKGLNQDVLVLDGKEGPVQNIAPNSLKFSPDGLRYAYAIGVSNSTGENSLLFDVDEKGASPAGSNGAGKKRMRYGGATRVVVDGKESRDYFAVATREILFSPDSRHVAYHASAPERPTMANPSVIVHDGVESAPYEKILKGTPVFSPDSQHLAFAAERDGQWRVVLDGKEGETYDGIDDSFFAFSADSRHLVSRARRGDRWFALVDGKELRLTEDGASGWVAFSPDSRRMAVVAFRGDRQNWLIDGKLDPAFDRVSKLTFSPNNQRFSYSGERSNQWHVVIDGVESRGYEMIIDSPGTPSSPDSRHVAYLTKRDGKFRLLLDGREGSEYDYVDRLLAFSPDSRHVAFLAGRGRVVSPGDQGEQVVVVVDGRETKPYVGIFPGLAFVGNSTVRVIAVRMNFETGNYELVRIEVSVPENSTMENATTTK